MGGHLVEHWIVPKGMHCNKVLQNQRITFKILCPSLQSEGYLQGGLPQQLCQLQAGALQVVIIRCVHHIHDGLHSPAVPLPHAAEPRLRIRERVSKRFCQVQRLPAMHAAFCGIPQWNVPGAVALCSAMPSRCHDMPDQPDIPLDFTV